MTGLIVAASILAYLAGLLLTARRCYSHLRPFTEPLSCKTPISCRVNRSHYNSCYRQSGFIYSTGEAAFWAVLEAVIWPALWIVLAFMTVITGGARTTPAEVRAANGRLERELGIGDKP